MTAVEKVALYNREYRARVKAEKKKVVHQATTDEMKAMVDTWLETNEVKQLSNNSKEFSMPAPMYISGGMGGSLV